MLSPTTLIILFLKTSSQIRQDFFDFFKSKGHKIVPSASVIPYNDPTLLFTNAGMNQFKDVFLGTGKRDYTRCADTQKCIRVSGKHNDLEEVGHDGSHHTFFEMLGNWSFGDYYKKEAISWAWELLTEVWKLDKSRLWATVYKDDGESFNLWKTETDLDHSRILKFDAKDNFWEMGDTGPCGPCSEIHYDFTEEANNPELVNTDPRIVEIWNLVFIQYNRDADGKLHELPKKHVDTGMGFERMVSVLQKKKSNYETDIFLPLINELIHITGKEYSGDKYTSAMNVIADHVRTLTFAIADGAIPSNEGRGYVLRRILRRAARYGRNLDMRKPFIYKLVGVLVQTMGNVFPEIVENKIKIIEYIEAEEQSFNEALDRGLVFFNEEIGNMEKNDLKIFSGAVAFKLHDTYGFPVDLTQLMVKEKGYSVELKLFDELMRIQKERARSARKDELGNIIQPDGQRYFEGQQTYDPYSVDKNNFEMETSVIVCNRDVEDSTLYSILPRKLPLYVESGGQVSDTGQISIGNLNLAINYILKSGFLYVNSGSDVPNLIYNNDDRINIKVDYPRRLSIQRNHSATHLVHEALRRVLGPHVKQMGSYLDDKLLRFDFPHFHKLKDDEINAIEEMVNDKVKENIAVNTRLMNKDEASKEYPNLRMFFGDKYGDEVRVVIIDDKYSVELCGGTHVKETSDIGLFKIVKEESISSGTRRIFARTGEGIIHLLNEKITDIEKLIGDLPEKYSNNFKSAIENFNKDFNNADFKDVNLLQNLLVHQDSTINSLLEQREKYLEEKKQLEKQLAKDKVKKASESLEQIIAQGIKLEGITIVKSNFDVDNVDELKEIGDALRNKLSNSVGVIYSVIEDKIHIVAVVTDNLVKEKNLSAGKIAGDVAKILGGGGGGKPHLATAGGKDISKISEAMQSVESIVKKYL